MCELTDGFDTHEWVGTQAWCNGKVATFGVSSQAHPDDAGDAPATRI